MDINIKSLEQTEEYGHKLAEQAKPGQVIALIGDLGTGKTTLTKAIAKGLNIADPISSPTFNIIKEYNDGDLPLYHFDVYRINDIEEMYNLGYEEYFFGDGLTVVEWADKIKPLIPKDAIQVELLYGEDPETRIYRRQG